MTDLDKFFRKKVVIFDKYGGFVVGKVIYVGLDKILVETNTSYSTRETDDIKSIHCYPGVKL